jgi:hypothetical protein
VTKALLVAILWTVALALLFVYVIPCDDGFWRGFRLYFNMECR